MNIEQWTMDNEQQCELGSKGTRSLGKARPAIMVKAVMDHEPREVNVR